MNSRVHTIEGIVIKRKNIGEADKLLTLFTKTNGKMQVKAKGVRKITSKRASHIELLNHGFFTIYQRLGGAVLTEVTTITSFAAIKDDLSTIGFAYHVCELVDRLCPEGQEHEEVFNLLRSTLTTLPTSTHAAGLMNAFGRKLLELLGYGYGNEELQKKPVSYLIEGIIENKLKARQILPKLLYSQQ